MTKTHKLTIWLSNKNNIAQTIYISMTAFLVYACMYGIRKSFTVAEFKGLNLWGIDFKAIIIISQVLGYAVSKFIGIRVISEMTRRSRAVSIIILTGVGELALILFNLVPFPYNFIMLFFNGLPLGLIWGLVFAYLEGRRTTEILGTALSISFIVSSGFAKSVGKTLINVFHLTDFQMPWVTGMVFYIPLFGLVWLIDKIPEPTAEDEIYRTRRIPMNKNQRNEVFREFSLGLILMTITYMILTIYRDLRDNFAIDIWKSIGVNDPVVFTISELPIAMVVFVVMSSMIVVKNNRKALIMNNLIVLSGFIIIGLGTFALKIGIIASGPWIVIVGLGTYMGYLPFNCLIFDRLIAAFGTAANAGFFIYIADSFGYLGSVAILFFKNFSNRDLSWFTFLKITSFWLSVVGCLLVFLSTIYLKTRLRRKANESLKVLSAG
jgi:MFS family permease